MVFESETFVEKLTNQLSSVLTANSSLCLPPNENRCYEMGSNDKMKTAVTVLQEMMTKLGEVPEYECIAQSGPAHSALFEYRCRALGVTVTAVARSKREAKQEAACAALRALAARGHPPPAGPPPHPARAASPPPAPAPAARTHVALLKELCEQYRLGGAQYELVSDTGPAHLRLFTVRAAVGRHQRDATATTKKAARQLAAQQLYQYLRDHLARLTGDFVEEEALARAHDKAMERYQAEEPVWRPDLAQPLACYHTGLITHTEPAQREAALRALAAGPAGDDELVLAAAAAALGMAVEWSTLPRAGGALHVVELAPAAPPLTLAGHSRAAACRLALRCVRERLR